MVLGAGASNPYGFPCGREFKNRIVRLLDKVEDLPDSELTEEFIDRFRTSGESSPDRFLEDPRHHKYLAVGKLCIARVLAAREIDENLWAPNVSVCWYEEFVNSILVDNERDLGIESDEIYFDPGWTIVTFNYDRSLEHYLWRRVKSKFGELSDRSTRCWQSRPEIIHVHGLLGAYRPYTLITGDAGRSYAPASGEDAETIAAYAASEIQIIHESDSNSQEFRRARDAIYSASSVTFLGFGYDQRNLSKLDTQWSDLARRGVRLDGTVQGIDRDVVLNHLGLSPPVKEWHDTQRFRFGSLLDVVSLLVRDISDEQF